MFYRSQQGRWSPTGGQVSTSCLPQPCSRAMLTTTWHQPGWRAVPWERASAEGTELSQASRPTCQHEPISLVSRNLRNMENCYSAFQLNFISIKRIVFRTLTHNSFQQSILLRSPFWLLKLEDRKWTIILGRVVVPFITTSSCNLENYLLMKKHSSILRKHSSNAIIGRNDNSLP